MIVDLHNHTQLCNHAEGEMEAYVQKAIEAKTLFFGFSDHAPMNLDQEYRMTLAQMREYEDSVLTLKEKYADKIEILLGYEVDFLPGYMEPSVLNASVDYLIGSVHFIGKWGFDNPEFIGEYSSRNIDEIWQDYFDAIEEMAKSGYFDIVGHLDLIKIFKFMPTKNILDIANNALIAIKHSGMSIEINAAGLRKPIAQTYPSIELLQKIKEMDIDISFGSDAHAPSQVAMFDDEILKIIKNIGFTQFAYYKNRKKYFVNIPYV